MAIDTTEKKMSLIDWDEATGEALPMPDGSLDTGDLQHFLWSYSGIAFGAPPAAPTGVPSGSVDRVAWQESAWQPNAVVSSAWSFARLFPRRPQLIGGLT